MEDMDVTDRNFRPCKCGYQICLFCYRHIKDDLNGLCPACRTPYDEANVSFVTPDPQE
jgi:CCR4-NOT transcription complex subunit 4